MLPVTICFNSLTIFLILKFKHLHQTTFFLALQVVLIDTVYSVTTIPVAIANAQAGGWILGLHFCNVNGAMNAFYRKMRNLVMFVLVFDRFCTVFRPFHYPSKRRKVVLPLYALASSLVVTDIIVTLVNDCYGFTQIGYFSVNMPGCKNPALCEAFSRAFEISVILIERCSSNYVHYTFHKGLQSKE